MTLELPEGLRPVASLVGGRWPGGDEDGLDALADHWEPVAAALSIGARRLAAGAESVADMAGPAAAALTSTLAWQAEELREQAAFCDSMARQCRDTALAVAHAKLLIYGALVAFSVQAVAAAYTFAASPAVLAARRSWTQRLVNRAFGESVTRVGAVGRVESAARAGLRWGSRRPVRASMAAAAGGGATLGGGLGGATELAAQEILARQGRLDGYDSGSLAAAAVSGALSGLFGGLAGFGGSYGAMRLVTGNLRASRLLGGVLARRGGRGGIHVLGTAAGGVAGGLAGSYASFVAGAGDWTPTDAQRDEILWTGIGGGLLGSAAVTVAALRSHAAAVHNPGLRAPSIRERWEAARVLGESAFRPPRLHTAPLLDEMSGVRMHLALENTNPMSGSIKDRAAVLVLGYGSDLVPGQRLVVASSGNHAVAYAVAAQRRGTPITTVLPETTSQAKVARLTNAGAEIVLHGQNYNEAYAFAVRHSQETGGRFMDVSDHRSVAALGTVVGDMLRGCPDATVVVLPGAGGTIVSAARMVREYEKHWGKRYLVIAAAPESAPTLYESFRAGRLTPAAAHSGAEALNVTVVDPHLLSDIRKHVDDVVTVPDRWMAQGAALLTGVLGKPVELAGALGPMALVGYQGQFHGASGRRYDLRGQAAVTVVTGGNITMERLTDIRAMPEMQQLRTKYRLREDFTRDPYEVDWGWGPTLAPPQTSRMTRDVR